MKSLRARLAKIGTLLAGATLIWACNAPPIVVPPPAVAFADASSGQQTAWTASQLQPFSLAAAARFYIFDETKGAGVIQTADANGTFTTTPVLTGSLGDRVSLYYATPAGDYSDSICLLLAEGPGLAPPCP
jgi:hypothetical protein